MTTSKVLAFFPWAYIDEPITAHDVRLIPYTRGQAPNNIEHTSLNDLDNIFSAYSNGKERRVNRATILELDNWQSGMPVNPDVVSRLFRVRTLLSTSAISNRELFSSTYNYCNYDSLELVVQNYIADSASSFAFHTRRRDGFVNHMWSSSEFAFQRPYHVDNNYKLNFDKNLFEALLKLNDKEESIFESLVEFNGANTDSNNLPIYSEMVMMKSAFEWLFKINNKASSFTTALNSTLSDIDTLPYDESLNSNWFKRWKSAKRPIDAWSSEFCALRGISAHGLSKSESSLVWSAESHLAFASTIFPLLLKKVLHDRKLMVIGEIDIEKLKRIDCYLMSNPFDFNFENSRSEHPWTKIDTSAKCNIIAKLFYSETYPASVDDSEITGD